MKVLAINETVNLDNTIDIIVEIADKKNLVLNFQNTKKLPMINDCIFLTLYLQAMQDGTDFVFPETSPVSETLVKNLAKHQDIFSLWFPKDLSSINVDVTTIHSEQGSENAISLFSGGVDSFYTFIENKEELSHIFLCIGLDIQLEEKVKIKLAIESYRKLAARNNKQLLITTTNMRHVFPHGNRMIQHVAILSALVLAYGFKTLYIPASDSIDKLEPWGSHPLTDHLFSNGITNVIHHGCVPRSQKTVAIAESREALKYLRVCNSSDEYNCGKCEKCLRTMFIFNILNCESGCLPKLDSDFSILNSIKIYDEGYLFAWEDNYDFAIKHNREDIARYAKKIIFSYHLKQWLKQGITLFKEMISKN